MTPAWPFTSISALCPGQGILLITLWWGILLSKFGSYRPRAFLTKFTTEWPISGLFWVISTRCQQTWRRAPYPISSFSSILRSTVKPIAQTRQQSIVGLIDYKNYRKNNNNINTLVTKVLWLPLVPYGVPWNPPPKKTTFPQEFCNEICTIHVCTIKKNHNSGKKIIKM